MKYKIKKLFFSTIIVGMGIIPLMSETQAQNLLLPQKQAFQGFNLLEKEYNTYSFNSVRLISSTSPLFQITKNTKSNLNKGYVSGLNVSTGNTKDQVKKLYGNITSSRYIEGGKAYFYKYKPYTAFFFEHYGKLSSIIIDRDDLKVKTFAEARKILGTPTEAGYDEMGKVKYSMIYTYKNATLFIESDRNNQDIDRIFIKFENRQKTAFSAWNGFWKTTYGKDVYTTLSIKDINSESFYFDNLTLNGSYHPSGVDGRAQITGYNTAKFTEYEYPSPYTGELCEIDFKIASSQKMVVTANDNCEGVYLGSGGFLGGTFTK